MPGIVQGKEPLLAGLEGNGAQLAQRLEHGWDPPTGTCPFIGSLRVVEPDGDEAQRRGHGLYPWGCTVAERRQTDDRGQLKVPALRTAGAQGAERPRRGRERAGVAGESGGVAASRRHLAPRPGSRARLPLPSAACAADKQVCEIHGLPLRWDCLHR